MGLARFDVLVVRSDIADVREGEGDDLFCVARVGHHLLVAGHGGIEAQLPDRFALGTEALAPDHSPIGEHDNSRRAFQFEARVQWSYVGHGRSSLPSGFCQRCR